MLPKLLKPRSEWAWRANGPQTADLFGYERVFSQYLQQAFFKRSLRTSLGALSYLEEWERAYEPVSDYVVRVPGQNRKTRRAKA
jgi:hypothetical protein